MGCGLWGGAGDLHHESRAEQSRAVCGVEWRGGMDGLRFFVLAVLGGVFMALCLWDIRGGGV